MKNRTFEIRNMEKVGESKGWCEAPSNFLTHYPMNVEVGNGCS
jgi:hypothetical protein